MNRVEYQKYLASREWAERKNGVRERCLGYCERCLIAPYESTHHLTYINVGHEPLDDLLAVCNPCHEFLSAKREEDPKKSVVLAVMAIDQQQLICSGDILFKMIERWNLRLVSHLHLPGENFCSLCVIKQNSNTNLSKQLRILNLNSRIPGSNK